MASIASSRSSMGPTKWTVAEASKALFCPDCGSILDLPDSMNLVNCPDCPFTVQVTDAEASAQTQSKVMESDIETVQQQVDPTMRRAVVAEPCPKCEYPELRFYTMQMRSVDEGQTVFYECEKCGHTYSTNT